MCSDFSIVASSKFDPAEISSGNILVGIHPVDKVVFLDAHSSVGFPESHGHSGRKGGCNAGTTTFSSGLEPELGSTAPCFPLRCVLVSYLAASSNSRSTDTTPGHNVQVVLLTKSAEASNNKEMDDEKSNPNAACKIHR